MSAQYQMDGPEDLLASFQSLLMLMIVLMHGFSFDVFRDLGDPSDGEILIASWGMRVKLAKTGLFLPEEVSHTMPDWREWAFVEAKRRTILASHHFEWAWSIIKGYPILTCFELGPLPAPEAGYLWQETDERRWKLLFKRWLALWKGGPFRMCEFFHIGEDVEMDERTEQWYAEADDYGMMLIIESECY
jgi:hypothetical protein